MVTTVGSVIGPNNGIYKTDRFGRITITGLTPGTVITAKETKTLDGFILDSTPQSIEIKKGEVQQMTFYNTRVGGVEIIKVNADDKSERLGNVTFEIRRMDGGLVDTVTTNERGRVYRDMDAGDYYLVEIETLEDFVLDKVFENKVPNFIPNDILPWEEDEDLLQWLTQLGKAPS